MESLRSQAPLPPSHATPDSQSQLVGIMLAKLESPWLGWHSGIPWKLKLFGVDVYVRMIRHGFLSMYRLWPYWVVLQEGASRAIVVIARSSQTLVAGSHVSQQLSPKEWPLTKLGSECRLQAQVASEAASR